MLVVMTYLVTDAVAINCFREISIYSISELALKEDSMKDVLKQRYAIHALYERLILKMTNIENAKKKQQINFQMDPR